MIPFPNKKYNIIYADPAWSYNDKLKHHGGSAESHYEVMTMEDIYNLPVQDIADENCALFLWVTFPNLPACLETFNRWGFQYKTIAFNWIKTNKVNKKIFFGIGHYTRSNAEVCLLGIKGKLPVVDKTISSIVMSEREQHSKKPNIIKDKIVQLYGDLPRIELFARETTDGWDSWGNEV